MVSIEHSPNSPSHTKSLGVKEISLADILRFLKSSWKYIAVFGFAGITIAIIYLTIAPKQFEAISQIAMAQIASGNAKNNSSIVLQGTNIEEPSLLILRMSFPTSFTPQVLEACGYQHQHDPGSVLGKFIKFTIPKGVANVVELRVIASTPQAAQDCGLAIFNLIKTTQSEMLSPYIEEAKIKLADDKLRLSKTKNLVANADRSGSVMSTAAYLSTRDEIEYLLDEIGALENIISSNQNRATRQIAPIYVSNLPTSPKKPMVLAAGLFLGILLGILIALVASQSVKLRVKYLR